MRRATTWARALAVLIAASGAVLFLAPMLGWERWHLVAATLPARSGLTTAAVVGLLLTAGASVRRSWRAPAIPLAASLALVTALHAPVVIARGTTTEPVAAPAPGQLRVLEWNTNGALVTPDVVAQLAQEQQADVVVLPQRALKDGNWGFRRAFNRAGYPMKRASAGDYRAQVSVWMTADLAPHYRYAYGPDPEKSVALIPVPAGDPDAVGLPAILALHAPWPVGSTMDAWRRDLDWVTDLCSTGSPVVVAGDFNASIDDFGGATLGNCIDAAWQRDGASVGTWSTRLPTLLAMPIDHVLLTPSAGEVASFTVLTDQDGSGARHRPVMAVITLSATAQAATG
ncbi:endonuclease/exonuclease/phosphatase family protein [Streptomyces sp. NP160]|uniref:endonuclease/exonuclease/phosphatase family protein n=1 Tax=Streptomyces sp. NP160 TaxID=2586637 RepID=UPI00111B91C9|nr:endonuclease/exonuclease/phosphatase family protein [Streptomyces sp. NP160]TNM59473.1 endonuclease/exonuclease/phosphatase family protein [Streptomyces sp. NP160]